MRFASDLHRNRLGVFGFRIAIPGDLRAGFQEGEFRFGGTVHFVYVGIEIMAFGMLLVWVHHRWWRTKGTGAVSR